MKRLAILGGGSWGTALAVILAPRFESICLWVRRPELAAAIQETGENADYLPEVAIPGNVRTVSELRVALVGAEAVLSVLPSHAVRTIFGEIKPFLINDLPVITATKGLESGSLLRISEVIAEAAGERPIAVLSGPSFAREAAAGMPTAVVVASINSELAEAVQATFSGPAFRVYSSGDPVGVELGGAYKNVVAIGAGVCHGLGLGHNALAALITRGLAEMTRLGMKMGAHPLTLAGLAGMGDLVLTCTGSLSRNRLVGEQLAAGWSLGGILQGWHMVAEGVGATRSIVKLGERYGVELPIACQMDAVINSGRPPGEAIRLLMERALKNE
jgi:glycerol-3-phosphate dehydrogenase (NAD(P)+)